MAKLQFYFNLTTVNCIFERVPRTYLSFNFNFLNCDSKQIKINTFEQYLCCCNDRILHALSEISTAKHEITLKPRK